MIFNSIKASVKVIGLISAAILSTTGSVLLIPTTVEARPVTTIAQSQTVLASGNFQTIEQAKATTGTARIIEEGGKRYLEFDSTFSTADGPDVFVVLSRSGKVSNKLEEGDYRTIEKIKSFSGAQRYELPGDINLDEFESVVIWCRQFNVNFGYAPL